MLTAKEEKWLKDVLEDCFQDIKWSDNDEKTLAGFKTLLVRLINNLEERVKEMRLFCNKNVEREVLREKLAILARQLFYLRRFCQNNTKRKK